MILKILACLIFLSMNVFSAPIALDFEQKARAQNLYQIVRCPVCAGQSIGDSDADISADLRLVIDQKIQQGLSDDMIKNQLIDIYGQDILFEPPNNAQTFLLNYGIWILMLLAAVIFIYRRVKFTNLKSNS